MVWPSEVLQINGERMRRLNVAQITQILGIEEKVALKVLGLRLQPGQSAATVLLSAQSFRRLREYVKRHPSLVTNNPKPLASGDTRLAPKAPKYAHTDSSAEAIAWRKNSKLISATRFERARQAEHRMARLAESGETPHAHSKQRRRKKNKKQRTTKELSSSRKQVVNQTSVEQPAKRKPLLKKEERANSKSQIKRKLGSSDSRTPKERETLRVSELEERRLRRARYEDEFGAGNSVRGIQGGSPGQGKRR